MGLLDSLFGSSKSESSVPDWVRQPIMNNVNRAERVANMGYTPYYGPDVAAFTPMQNAAFDGMNMAASAFGMPSATGNGMPAPQTFAGGIQGYSSAPMYEQALAALKAKDPQRYKALMQMQRPEKQQSAAPAQSRAMQARSLSEYLRLGGDPSKIRPGMFTVGSEGGGAPAGAPHSGRSSYTSINTPLSYLPGGVNTANPASLINQAIGGATNGFGYSASRPAPNPMR